MVDWKCFWFQIRLWAAPLYRSHPHWWSINSSSCSAALLWSLSVCPNEELRHCDILAWGHWRISRTCLSCWILLILIFSACAGGKHSEDQPGCPYCQRDGGFGKSGLAMQSLQVFWRFWPTWAPQICLAPQQTACFKCLWKLWRSLESNLLFEYFSFCSANLKQESVGLTKSFGEEGESSSLSHQRSFILLPKVCVSRVSHWALAPALFKLCSLLFPLHTHGVCVI